MKSISSFSRFIEKIASGVVNLAGRTSTVFVVFLFVLAWAISGFFLDFSARWEMIIGTMSSVITILMVFLILKSQNKDSLSIQLKLNELVASNEAASNRLVNVEGMTEDELKVIQKYYLKLSEFTKRQDTLQQSHSIDEIHEEHTIKKEMEDELVKVKK
ncbi:MAG TPA: low affinity iron permease family protein [Puia sp.]|jgi:low affinity Fe/Cu permease|nr:low affinity iron permease family protein [Puia sp.]